jgi:hypothetical protein
MTNPLKLRLLIAGGAAALTAGGVAGFALSSHGVAAAPASIGSVRLAATQPNTQAPAATPEPADGTAEPAETPGAEAPSQPNSAEPAEAPGTPDAGHADDPNNPNVDYQFDGQQ